MFHARRHTHTIFRQIRVGAELGVVNDVERAVVTGETDQHQRRITPLQKPQAIATISKQMAPNILPCSPTYPSHAVAGFLSSGQIHLQTY
jgi:hypothetical protein